MLATYGVPHHPVTCKRNADSSLSRHAESWPAVVCACKCASHGVDSAFADDAVKPAAVAAVGCTITGVHVSQQVATEGNTKPRLYQVDYNKVC
jgi:hypothetical protein